MPQVPITFADSSRRAGTYYLPPGYRNNARPLMVAFHGLDGHGSDMVSTFMVCQSHNAAAAQRCPLPVIVHAV